MLAMKQTDCQIAVLHPGLGLGGSEAPVLWTISALKTLGHVTLITTGDVDLARMNAYYSADLAPEDFAILRVPLPVGLRHTQKFAGLKASFFQRYVLRIASKYDLLIGCYGPMDFGRRGMQMIADFSFVEEWRYSLHPGVRSWKRWWYGPSLLRHLYMKTCRVVSKVSPDGWRKNLNLANSDWTANLTREKLGLEAQTLYPPVETDFPKIPFSERDDGFVCLGRISPEKRVDSMIEILSRVRQRGHNVHLHILGGVDDSPYGARVKSLARQNRAWVFLEGWAVGDAKKRLLAGHKYGIHGRENEPFGIAVGEMVNAGCIVFVPNGGGQMEIVNHPALVFKDESEAVDKIDAVLKSDSERENLCQHLQRIAGRFSPENFQAQIRQTVDTFLREEVVA
jgi:glycosyltransferase involved in cell wall biosynthesis